MQSGNWTTNKFPNAIDFDVFISSGSSIYKWPELDERSAMALCYTSGILIYIVYNPSKYKKRIFISNN